jgi:hypothetical protein
MLSIADIETAILAYLDEIPQETDGYLSGFDVTKEAAKELFEGLVRYLKN